MPFTHDRGLVAILLEDLGHGNFRGIETGAVILHAVEVGMLSCLQGCSYWPADRIGYKVPGEFDAFIGEAVDIGGLDKGFIISADSIFIVVVAHDIDDVRALGEGQGWE